MPEKETLQRAKEDKREGKAASTQAGEFVREEIEHVREGKHGARSTKQAIAIGLSKARRAGVKLAPPKKGTVSEETRRQAERDARKGKSGAKRKPSAKRSRATRQALKREGTSAGVQESSVDSGSPCSRWSLESGTFAVSPEGCGYTQEISGYKFESRGSLPLKSGADSGVKSSPGLINWSRSNLYCLS